MNDAVPSTDQDVALRCGVDLKEPEAFLQAPNTFVLGAYVDGVTVGLAWG